MAKRKSSQKDRTQPAIAVLASGSGTNLQAIIDAIERGDIPARIALVVSDQPDAYALKRAAQAGIETLVVRVRDFKSREAFDAAIIAALQKHNVELVVLAGFMRLLSSSFIHQYQYRIMNIHPALLPAFKGTHGVRDALTYGAKVTGATVHFVDDELDHGPIILQRAVEVRDSDTEATLLERIHREEHVIYPKAVKLFVEKKLHIEGRRVKIR